jgi:two-component system chemotaxis response regulator CheY
LTPEEFQNLHVLVIEDEDFIRRLIVRLLREIGIQMIYEATDGREGLEVLESRSGDVDLVLCDLEMPKMDGLQFIRGVRSDKTQKIAQLPIIVLTGHSEDAVVRGAVSMNIDGYVVKPVSKKVLVERIVHAMRNAAKK